MLRGCLTQWLRYLCTALTEREGTSTWREQGVRPANLSEGKGSQCTQCGSEHRNSLQDQNNALIGMANFMDLLCLKCRRRPFIPSCRHRLSDRAFYPDSPHRTISTTPLIPLIYTFYETPRQFSKDSPPHLRICNCGRKAEHPK